MSSQDVDHLVAVLEHDAGFSIDLFAILTLVRLENGRFAVWKWDEGQVAQEKLFTEARPAVLYFLERRRRLRLGYDYDAPLLHVQTMKAAMRDASFNRTNGVAHQYHIVIVTPGIMKNRPGYTSACNPRSMLLVEETMREAKDVAEYSRCRRPGCASRWPR